MVGPVGMKLGPTNRVVGINSNGCTLIQVSATAKCSKKTDTDPVGFNCGCKEAFVQLSRMIKKCPRNRRFTAVAPLTHKLRHAKQNLKKVAKKKTGNNELGEAVDSKTTGDNLAKFAAEWVAACTKTSKK